MIQVSLYGMFAAVTAAWPTGPEQKMAQHLITNVPTALHATNTTRVDGFAKSPQGRGSKNTISDPTSTAAISSRLAPSATRLIQSIKNAHIAATNHDRPTARHHLEFAVIVTNSMLPHTHTKESTCARVHNDDNGLDPWVDDDCDNIASAGHGGLCVDCFTRRRSMLSQHPPRR